MRQITLYRYRLPFKHPVKITSAIVLEERVGAFLKFYEVQGEEKRTLVVELAPLAGFSQENLDEALEQLVSFFTFCDIERFLSGVEAAIAQMADYEVELACVFHASVRYALEALVMRYFNSHSAPIQLKAVPRVALMTLQNSDEAHTQVRQALEDSAVSAIKIKLGQQSPEKEQALIRDLAAAFSFNKPLRFDVNGRMDIADSIAHMRILKESLLLCGAKIEFVEEPFDATAYTVKHECMDAYARWHYESGLSFAWDETLIGQSGVLTKADWQTPGLRAVIVKPMVLGGLIKTQSIARMMASYPTIRMVLSSSYESPLGLWFLAQMAQQLDILPAGIDTLKAFTPVVADLWQKVPQNSDLDAAFLAHFNDYLIPLKTIMLDKL